MNTEVISHREFHYKYIALSAYIEKLIGVNEFIIREFLDLGRNYAANNK